MTRYESEGFINDDTLPGAPSELAGVVDIGAIKAGESLAPLVVGLLRSIGEDPAREGLLKTPQRVDAAYKFMTQGYHEDLKAIVNDAIFSSSNSDIVLVKDITFFSLCEHHMLPFFGKVHIAYVPDGKVIGISKLPRIADMFARRLQIQENLTQQIADALDLAVSPRGAAVIIEATHMCMVMRGVQKVGSTTVTRAFTGLFKEDEHLRQEVAKMIGR